jgi:hypothetical protein
LATEASDDAAPGAMTGKQSAAAATVVRAAFMIMLYSPGVDASDGSGDEPVNR